MTNLFEVLQSLAPLSENIISEIQQCTSVAEVPEATQLLAPGRCQDTLYFIAEGVVRHFYRSAGYEWTSRFDQEGDFVFSLENFICGLSDEVYIETCTPARLVCFPKKDYVRLMELFPELIQVKHAFGGKRLEEVERQRYCSHMLPVIEAYKWFVSSQPLLAARVKGKYIASYLGMSPETLSRIREKEFIEKE